MPTYTEHLDYIKGLRSKVDALPDGVIKPAHFYFIGWFGGRDAEDFEDEKDNCRFAVVLKSVFDARDGCWDDGERESKLMQAFKIPLYYESAGVYAFRNLMDTMSRLLGGKPANTDPPKHTPQEIRNLFLAAGFEENPQIILRWNHRAWIVVNHDDDWL